MLEKPQELQGAWRKRIIRQASRTVWGTAFHFHEIKDQSDFAQAFPVQDYASLKPYINRVMQGEKDVLWPGQTKWFAKSSGTTSGKSKYIPMTAANLTHCHKKGAWDTTTILYHNRSDANQFAYKSMIMGGSLAGLDQYPEIQVGDVSAVMLKHLPFYLHPFILPDVKTALMPEWEKKLELLAIAGAKEKRVVMIGGVPTWTVVLFRRILEITGKEHMLEVWPDFQVYIHGGVSFTPYRKQFEAFFPSPKVQYLEIYNASEGYFGIQDRLDEEGLLLLVNNGIYYEFIPMDQWDKEDPETLPLSQVKLGGHYALVISTNGGLWRYTPGDTVQFTSLHPYRIKVTGRTKQFVNTFGEEVIVDNTDEALAMTCRELDTIVSEYTVAPVYFSSTGKGGHQWLVEFEKLPTDINRFSQLLDQNLQQVNSDYEAKRYKDMALKNLKLQAVPEGTFHDWLSTKGKAGGQHKVPRLANNRKYIDDILQFLGEQVP